MGEEQEREQEQPGRSAVGRSYFVLEVPRECEGMASSVSGVLYFPSSALPDWSCQALD